MTVPDGHEPWCAGQRSPHALCRRQIAVIAVGTDVTIEVELRRSVNTPTVVVVLVHRAGRVHTVTMNVEAAHNLGAAIDEAVRHLRPVGG